MCCMQARVHLEIHIRRMSEKQYNTLGNGGLMYRVFDNTEKKELRVITPEPLAESNAANTTSDSELANWVDASRYKPSEIRIPYKRIWIAHDPDYVEDGFEIIAEIFCYENVCSYIFIGPTVTFFWTPQPIEIYHSYVGNSGVPYGFAATKDYVYGFAHDHSEAGQVIVVSRRRIEARIRTSLNAELTQDHMWEAVDEIMKLPHTTVHQETLHDNFNADEYIPFDQGRFQEIMRNAKLLGMRRVNYGNTRAAVASRVPMNVAHQIAEFRTGLVYRPTVKPLHNTRVYAINPIGPLPNNFHGTTANIRTPNIVPVVTSKKCKSGKCAIMGGRRTYKRHTNRRKTVRR